MVNSEYMERDPARVYLGCSGMYPYHPFPMGFAINQPGCRGAAPSPPGIALQKGFRPVPSNCGPGNAASLSVSRALWFFNYFWEYCWFCLCRKIFEGPFQVFYSILYFTFSYLWAAYFTMCKLCMWQHMATKLIPKNANFIDKDWKRNCLMLQMCPGESL